MPPVGRTNAATAATLGISFSPRVTEELTTRLQEVLTNRVLREEMCRQGLRRAQAFSWKRSARAALAVFEELGRDCGASRALTAQHTA